MNHPVPEPEPDSAHARRVARRGRWILRNNLLVIAVVFSIAALGAVVVIGLPAWRIEQFHHRAGLVTVTATVDRQHKSCHRGCRYDTYVSYRLNGIAYTGVRVTDGSSTSYPSPVSVLVDPEHPRTAQPASERGTRGLVLVGGFVALYLGVAAVLSWRWSARRSRGRC